MAGALVITGVPTKLGYLLVESAGVNLAAMIGMGFLFGAILGTGLPPAPVYILVAIVIAPPFMQAGINPWAVHFFAFFVGCVRRVDPTDIDHRGDHIQDRQRVVLCDTLAIGADLHSAVHAHGWRVRSS